MLHVWSIGRSPPSLIEPATLKEGVRLVTEGSGGYEEMVAALCERRLVALNQKGVRTVATANFFTPSVGKRRTPRWHRGVRSDLNSANSRVVHPGGC